METVCGIHAVRELLKTADTPVERVHLQQHIRSQRIQEIIELCRLRGVPARFEPPAALERMARGAHHQGVVAIVGGYNYARLEELLARVDEAAFLLLLDGVQDTHNLGALIRTACAAGVDGVILPERRSAGLSPAVVQAASGAAAHVPVARVTNLSRTLDHLKEASFWIFGLDERGETPYYAANFRGRCAILVGGEEKGIHHGLKKNCDFLLNIPTFGKIGTLNVSVAAGIVLFEAARQRATGRNQPAKS